MQIKSFKELQNLHRDKKLGNFVLIHGNDKEKVKKSEDYIKGLVINIPELNLVEISGNNITIDAIRNACETIPVMGDIRVVHIKTPGFLLEFVDAAGKILLGELIDYVNNIPEYTILLISHWDIIDKSNKILKIAPKIGTLVEYKVPAYGRELTSFIESFLKEKGKSINKSDVFYLSSELTNSTDILEKELEKLISYAGDKELIEKSDIDSIIHKTSESNIFKMADYMFKRDARGALEILDTLFLQGEQYPRIMFMIIRQFRILYSVKVLLDEGKSPKDIMSTLKMQEFVYKGIVKVILGWDEKEIKGVLEDALDSDYKIKSGKISPELGLEMLILKTCK